ncbi:MAG: hypothetical protein U0793_01450 [Gemmataceae bacterium]
MLVVGVGIGVALDRFVLPRSANPEMEIFEQGGPFDGAGGQGETNFPIPYAYPPNVKLDYTGRTIAVVEVKTTGFKWKDVGAGSHAALGKWTAKGVKANKVP